LKKRKRHLDPEQPPRAPHAFELIGRSRDPLFAALLGPSCA